METKKISGMSKRKWNFSEDERNEERAVRKPTVEEKKDASKLQCNDLGS